MFSFNSKRAQVPAAQSTSKPSSEDAVAQKAAQAAALREALALGGDEAAALEFVSQCQFADARLAAAEHIRTGVFLEQALRHTRNVDRRVAKLMTTRLDALKHTHEAEQRATSCIDAALRLAGESQCLPNQVADIDREWNAIETPSTALQKSFGEVRERLGARLEAQAATQRSVLQIIDRMRELSELTAGLSSAAIAGLLDVVERDAQSVSALPESASLPRNLLQELRRQGEMLRDKRAVLESDTRSLGIREEMLARWEKASPDSMKAEFILKEWQSLDAMADDSAFAALEERFEALSARIAEAGKSKKKSIDRDGGRWSLVFAELLDAMEKALREGSVQAAAEQDRKLRALDLKPRQLADAQTARLNQARSELGRLQGWAKWGGNVSREELLKTAEELSQNPLPPAELAKKVGSLRERWKSLDASAGPAGKNLWMRFDAVCTEAYAPAAAHFKKLAEERQQNMANASALINELSQFASGALKSVEEGRTDWKAVALFCRKATQGWSHLGPMDRKEKKRLDGEFARVMETLALPLAEQTALEINRRERLIEEVRGMNAADRGVLDALRAAQERWQSQAKSFPLERSDEQALWQRFRSAGEAIFAKRKEVSSAADTERKKNLHAREQICADLESAAGRSDNHAKILRDAKEAWGKIGTVPRASESRIDARYRSALNALEAAMAVAGRVAAEAESNVLRDRLRLCRTIESAIVDGAACETDHIQQWEDAWRSMPTPPAAFNTVLESRLRAGLKAAQQGDRSYAETIAKNRTALMPLLMRCEIVFGLESPAEFSRERLKLQVEVLQASLKAGQKAPSHEDLIREVCALAAASDAAADQRLERAIAHFRGGRTK